MYSLENRLFKKFEIEMIVVDLINLSLVDNEKNTQIVLEK